MSRSRASIVAPILAALALASWGILATPRALAADPPGISALKLGQAQCERAANRAWTHTRHGPECIAYFATRAGAQSKRAVIYFQGDYLPDQLVTNETTLSRQARTLSTLERMAERTNAHFVIIARPGTLGSTGYQARDKHHRRELEAMNMTIDIVKQRLGVETVALAGQSGGSFVIGGILTAGRSDIACAAAGSGVYSLTDRWRSLGHSDETIQRRLRTAPRDNPWYSPKEDAVRISPDSRRRIFILGDTADANTLFVDQKKYADELAERGHHVRLHRANGLGDKRHGLSHIALAVAGWCLNDVPDSAIAWGVERLGPVPLAGTDGR